MLLTTATGVRAACSSVQHRRGVGERAPGLRRRAAVVEAVGLLARQPGVDRQPGVGGAVRGAVEVAPLPHVREVLGQLVGRAAAVDRAPAFELRRPRRRTAGRALPPAPRRRSRCGTASRRSRTAPRRKACADPTNRPGGSVGRANLRVHDRGGMVRARRTPWMEWVARGGIEPPTYRFSGGRSYQLSYLAVSLLGGPAKFTGPRPRPSAGSTCRVVARPHQLDQRRVHADRVGDDAAAADARAQRRRGSRPRPAGRSRRRTGASDIGGDVARPASSTRTGRPSARRRARRQPGRPRLAPRTCCDAIAASRTGPARALVASASRSATAAMTAGSGPRCRATRTSSRPATTAGMSLVTW